MNCVIKENGNMRMFIYYNGLKNMFKKGLDWICIVIDINVLDWLCLKVV